MSSADCSSRKLTKGELLQRQIRAEQDAPVRKAFADRHEVPGLLKLLQGREAASAATDWEASAELAPTGVHAERSVLDNGVPLAEIVPFIDWTPFFHVWELRGRLPCESSTDSRSTASRRDGTVRSTPRAMLDRIVSETNRCTGQRRSTVSFPPPASGDDIVSSADDETRREELARFPHAAATTVRDGWDSSTPRAGRLRRTRGGRGTGSVAFAVTAGLGCSRTR